MSAASVYGYDRSQKTEGERERDGTKYKLNGSATVMDSDFQCELSTINVLTDRII